MKLRIAKKIMIGKTNARHRNGTEYRAFKRWERRWDSHWRSLNRGVERIKEELRATGEK